ncbi:MAG TPA: helix-turn-helix transcriptional regulator [Acidimicrobiales bacterium]|nr:helix-turn-helix transcriptional regulator [Acidimicrobiales bacterium]
MLLAEKPRHGYRLVDAFLGLGLGPVDRPSVYRALADLETDGLVTHEVRASKAGSSRHVYSVTDDGLRMLRTWTSVLCEQWDSLGQVISRAVVLPMRSAAAQGA